GEAFDGPCCNVVHTYVDQAWNANVLVIETVITGEIDGVRLNTKGKVSRHGDTQIEK
ncbi:unnamed protein product, partial [Arabidopsis halleri]